MNNRSVILASAIILFLTASPAFAASIKNYEIKYYIEGSSVRETIKINLYEVTKEISFTSGAVRDVTVSDNNGVLDYNIDNINGSYRWTIFPRNSTNIAISFYSDDMIFSSNDASQFFSEVSTVTHADNLDIYVILPPGNAVITFYPKNGATISDGKSIGIRWQYKNSDNLVLPISVKFENAKFDYIPYVLMGLMVVIVIVLIYYYRKRVHKEFMSGFFDDEKLVVKYLQKNNPAYQNKVGKEFKFSRAKMTRIVKKLEHRGLVKKERRGRTNRLEWKR